MKKVRWIIKNETVNGCNSVRRCLTSWMIRRNSSKINCRSSAVNKLRLTMYCWRNGSINWSVSWENGVLEISEDDSLLTIWLCNEGEGWRPQGFARNLANEKRTKGSPLSTSLDCAISKTDDVIKPVSNWVRKIWDIDFLLINIIIYRTDYLQKNQIKGDDGSLLMHSGPLPLKSANPLTYCRPT